MQVFFYFFMLFFAKQEYPDRMDEMETAEEGALRNPYADDPKMSRLLFRDEKQQQATDRDARFWTVPVIPFDTRLQATGINPGSGAGHERIGCVAGVCTGVEIHKSMHISPRKGKH